MNKLWRRVRPPRGLLVAFMGVDGAGKSSALDAVTRMLRGSGHVAVTTTYLGPWGHFRTRVFRSAHERGLTPPAEDWLQLAIDRIRSRRESPSVSYCLAKWFKGRIRGWSYYVTVYLEVWYRYFKDVKPALARGQVVLADRYIYDLRHLHMNRPTKLFPVMRWLVTRLYPRPHRVFFLHANPDRITARSSQLSAEEIVCLQEIYRHTLAGLPTVSVSSDRPANVVAEDVTGQIIRDYYRRR